MELRSDRRHNYSVHLTYCVSALYYLFIHISHPPFVPLRLSIIGLVDHREPQHHKSQAVYSVAMETVLFRSVSPCAWPVPVLHLRENMQMRKSFSSFSSISSFLSLRLLPMVYADGHISTGRWWLRWRGEGWMDKQGVEWKILQHISEM